MTIEKCPSVRACVCVCVCASGGPLRRELPTAAPSFRALTERSQSLHGVPPMVSKGKAQPQSPFFSHIISA